MIVRCKCLHNYSKCDFDIGVGEFSVAEKYLKNGWNDIILSRKTSCFNIVEIKPNTEYEVKEWWE